MCLSDSLSVVCYTLIAWTAFRKDRRLSVAATSTSVYTHTLTEGYKLPTVSYAVNNTTFMQTLDSSIRMSVYIITPQIGPVSAFCTRYRPTTHIRRKTNTAVRVPDYLHVRVMKSSCGVREGRDNILILNITFHNLSNFQFIRCFTFGVGPNWKSIVLNFPAVKCFKTIKRGEIRGTYPCALLSLSVWSGVAE